MNKKTFLIFFGAPGSGKGTQAQQLAAKLGLPVISTGEMLRQEIKEESELGRQVQAIMAAGQYVSDEIVGQMIIKRLKQADAAGGAIFDGYPRTAAQQEFLIAELGKSAAEVYGVLIQVSDDEVLRRQGGRRVCINGHVFHQIFNPPQSDGICDACGEKLFQRDDDKPEAVKVRLGIYHEKTEPLAGYWRSAGRLLVADGEQAIDKVQADLENELKTKDLN